MADFIYATTSTQPATPALISLGAVERISPAGAHATNIHLPGAEVFQATGPFEEFAKLVGVKVPAPPKEEGGVPSKPKKKVAKKRPAALTSTDDVRVSSPGF